MNQQINYEAEFCGRVPLNQTNLIQPHGVLLVLDRRDFRIVQASENVQDVFGMPAKELMEKSFISLVPGEAAALIRDWSARNQKEKIPFIFPAGDRQFLASIIVEEQYILIEIEKQERQDRDAGSFLPVYMGIKYAMTAIESAATVTEACELAAAELKKISGFDKVMVYRFDDDWNGDVIAEVMEEGMDSYLGLKFPASDIPRQARDLYGRLAYRFIPNIRYEPVKLYPVINPLVKSFTNLSASNLRSVAAVHLEYLSNMGVVASMSTRVMVDGKLWGLIACHHRTARYLPFEVCAVFELLSNIIGARVAALQHQEIFQYRHTVQEQMTLLIEGLYTDRNIVNSFRKNEGLLLRLLNADGLSFISNRQVYSFGTTPDEIDVHDLVVWLQARNVTRLFHEPSLSLVFEHSEKFADIGSGVLVLPVQPEKGSYLIAFRGEAIRKVNWGGNPNEAVNFEADGKKYHPRHSFRMWQQTVKHSATPWKPEEMEVAESFRNVLVEFALNNNYY